MKNDFLYLFMFLGASVFFVIMGCGKCEKLSLSQTEADWANKFKQGQLFLYENERGQIDTLLAIVVGSYYTPCNRFELSNYQMEVETAIFKFKTKKNYDGNEADIIISAQESGKTTPYMS